MQLSFDPPTDGSTFIDGRYIRALSYKPTVNGAWHLAVTAWDDRGCAGKSTEAATVVVLSGGL